ncbi:MAG: hypothetical protein RLZZ452_1003, partial [Pseudomonadota bacterium]
ATLGYFAVLLTVSLFIAVLIVLVRWYKDSEMIVWFASGLSITNLIGPILRFAIPLILIIALLAAFVWPWANRESSVISQRFQQRDDVSMVAAGQFKESAKAERVFFIEDLDVDKGEVKNIFVADTRNQKLSVKGRRYEGQPTQANFRILEFDEYETKILSKEVSKPPPRDREKNVIELIQESDPNIRRANFGELLWRIGLPIMALGLVLIAIPLAYVNPRLGNYTAMFYAVLIYLMYSNLLNLSQNYVSQGRVDFFIGLWPIHLIAFGLAFVLIRNRINPSVKWWQRQLPRAWQSK